MVFTKPLVDVDLKYELVDVRLYSMKMSAWADVPEKYERRSF